MPTQQRETDAVRAARSGALERVRQQPEQRSAQQRAGRKAHEVRGSSSARRAAVQQQEERRGKRAQQSAEGGERDDRKQG